jgi:hypothetical protein
MGGGWLDGCVWDPYWTCVDLCWDCVWVTNELYTLLLLSIFAYLEACWVCALFRGHVGVLSGI